MLEKYLHKLAEQRQAHPISKEAFHEWRDHPVTQRLFEDLELLIVNDAMSLRETTDSSAVSSYCGRKFLAGYVAEDWRPEEIEDDQQ